MNIYFERVLNVLLKSIINIDIGNKCQILILVTNAKYGSKYTI